PRTVRWVAYPLKNVLGLVQGATGFVGQAVVEKLLSAYPSPRLTLLVRPRGEVTAHERVQNLLEKDCFTPWRERIGAEAAAAEFEARINVLSGDLDNVPALRSEERRVGKEGGGRWGRDRGGGQGERATEARHAG